MTTKKKMMIRHRANVITEKTVMLWKGLSEQAAPHLKMALRPLAQAEGLVEDGLKLVDWLVRLLKTESEGKADFMNPIAQQIGLKGFESVGSAAAEPRILHELLDWYLEDPFVRNKNALVALGKIGPAVGQAEILDRLLLLLRDEEATLRGAACGVIERIGPGAARLDILYELLRCLTDRELLLQWQAGRALRTIGPAAAHPAIVEGLLSCLVEKNATYRYEAVGALAAMGYDVAQLDILNDVFAWLGDGGVRIRQTASTVLANWFRDDPRIIDELQPRLISEDPAERTRAARALAALRLATIPAETMNEFVARLFAERFWVKREIAWALRTTRFAQHPEAVSMILQLVRDQDDRVRCRAAEALKNIGPTAACKLICDELILRLGDQVSQVRFCAAKALIAIRCTNGVPKAVEEVLLWLKDPNDRNRSAAAETLGQIDRAFAGPEVLRELSRALWDDESQVQRCAANALGRFGSSAAQPQVLDALLDWLRERGMEARTAAVVVGKIGFPAARADIVKELLHFSGWDQPDNRPNPWAEALALMQDDGARFLAAGRGDLTVVHLNQLAAD